MKYLFSLFLIFFSVLAGAQNVTLSGHITDKGTGEELIGANIYVKSLQSGTITNAYGFYSLSIPPGKYVVSYSYTGYNPKDTLLELRKNLVLTIELAEDELTLKETVITGERTDKNVNENKMSVVSIDVKTIKKIPLLMGEVDIIKAIQLMPGVQSAGDGNTLSIVRGGNIDHNLVLLDEAVVYNPAHVVGFFSIFNGDAVKDFEMYKGGIPANFGGRLASVLDVRTKDGNSKNYGVSGGIGLLSSRLTIEGPIQKEKSSFFLSGRRSYFDLFLALDERTKDAVAHFYDINAKVNFKLGKKDKDRIFLSAYSGRDALGFGEFLGFGWGNTTTTLRWNHIFNSKWFSNASLIYSRYNYNIDFNIAENLNFSRKNYIEDIGLKYDLTYYASPKSTVKMGFFNTYHVFQPGKLEPITSESLILGDELPFKKAFSQAYYLSHAYDFSSRLNIEYGLRVSVFQNIGPSREFIYADGLKNVDINGSVKTGEIIDTAHYQSGDFYNTYYGLEPRMNLLYKLNSKSSIKASYNRMYQYMHLIQNIAASTGQEFWTPSTPHIKPQLADQGAIGYFRNFKDNIFEFSTEVYYKYMQNTVEIIDNADLNFNEAIESQIVAGTGRAYGLELLIRKNKGKTTGWIGYTISKSERKASNINNNNWYNFRYDRRHYATVVATHDLSKRWSFGANFIFATGNAYTAPVGQYELNGVRYAYYSERNAERIPAYHRLDISVTLNNKIKDRKRFKNESNWVFSIYNVYARKNYYTLDFREDPDTGLNQAYKSYLFTIVPAITYNFKF